MRDLKSKLIKLGSSHPDLRPHIRPILDQLTSRKTATVSAKALKGRLFADLQESISGFGFSIQRALNMSTPFSQIGSWDIDPFASQGEQTRIVTLITSNNPLNIPETNDLLAVQNALGQDWEVSFGLGNSILCNLVVDNVGNSSLKGKASALVKSCHDNFKNLILNHVENIISNRSRDLESVGLDPREIEVFGISPYHRNNLLVTLRTGQVGDTSSLGQVQDILGPEWVVKMRGRSLMCIGTFPY